jgi:hypothetical protein
VGPRCHFLFVFCNNGCHCRCSLFIGALQPGTFLTRARIRAPFDGEIISIDVKSSDTMDNVKAKIDNVKAKIQDEED